MVKRAYVLNKLIAIHKEKMNNYLCYKHDEDYITDTTLFNVMMDSKIGTNFFNFKEIIENTRTFKMALKIINESQDIDSDIDKLIELMDDHLLWNFDVSFHKIYAKKRLL